MEKSYLFFQQYFLFNYFVSLHIDKFKETKIFKKIDSQLNKSKIMNFRILLFVNK